MIYALLGLVVGFESAGLTADYSLPTSHVFTGIAAYLLTHYPYTEWSLFLASVHDSTRVGPSWVPSWNKAPYGRLSQTSP
jgi:hypothetical protein